MIEKLLFITGKCLWKAIFCNTESSQSIQNVNILSPNELFDLVRWIQQNYACLQLINMGFTIYYLPLTSFDKCFLRSCLLFSTIDLNSFSQISSEILHFINNYYFPLKSLVAYVLPLRSGQYRLHCLSF